MIIHNIYKPHIYIITYIDQTPVEDLLLLAVQFKVLSTADDRNN